MAMRVNYGVEPIKSPPGTDRGGSRPKPPKAVARRASLEASRPVPDHQKSKRCLTDKTVAFGLSPITQHPTTSWPSLYLLNLSYLL
jgi:hypothetical protein